MPKNVKITSRKIAKKTTLQKNHNFGPVGRSRRETDRILMHFGMILGTRWHAFPVFFWTSVLGWIFFSILSEKRPKGQNRKSSFRIVKS